MSAKTNRGISSLPIGVVKTETDEGRLPSNENDKEDLAGGERRWDVEVEARISLDLNLFICLACAGSKYSSREKLNLIRHIRAKHLPDFAGFVCELCPRVFNTRRGFESHMGLVHNILTVFPEKNNVVKSEEDSIVDHE